MSGNGRKSAHHRLGAIAAVTAASAALAVVLMQSAPIKAETPKAETLAAPIVKPQTDAPPVVRTAAGEPSNGFADIIAEVGPAVVSVRAAGVRPGGVVSKRGPGAERRQIPEQFRRFFGDDFMQRFGRGPKGRERGGRERREPRYRVPKSTSLGSGFIIDPAGYVVTNHHVINGAETIKVTLKKDKSYTAKLVGSDPKTDLALLKIDADEKLPFVRWGDSDKARVGDWVVTVGSPFGLGHTATLGIVSARGRNIGAGPYDDFIQMDAAINRGNSGGPAFNAKGEVIGVNTAIYSPNGGSVGIGFAIPAAMAKDVIAQIRENGAVERGWLGVQIQPVTREIADSLGLEDAKGALVSQIIPDSPASRSALRQGDVILSASGKPVVKFRDVARIVAGVKPNRTVAMGIWRGGKKHTVTVKIGKQPAPDRVAAANTAAPERDIQGLRLAALDQAARRAYRIGEDVAGVVVSGVRRDSPAARKGLRRGDVIVRIGRTDVTRPADAAARLDEAKRAGRKAVLLLINRRAEDRFIALPLRDT